MTLLDDLKKLVSKHDGAQNGQVVDYCPPEWAHYPKTEEIGRHLILTALANREPLPNFVSYAREATINFNCGPIYRMDCNPNGYMASSRQINWLDVVYTMIDGRAPKRKK